MRFSAKIPVNELPPREFVALPWKKYKKKPVVISAVRMDRAFTVRTKENRGGELLHGKKGDWLLKGVEGELYPCDDKIFRKTYARYFPPCVDCDGTGLIPMEEVPCHECGGTGREKKAQVARSRRP